MVFAFDPLHDLHFAISKLVKEGKISDFSFHRLRARGVQRRGNSFVIIRLRVLRGCNLLLSAIKLDG